MLCECKITVMPSQIHLMNLDFTKYLNIEKTEHCIPPEYWSKWKANIKLSTVFPQKQIDQKHSISHSMTIQRVINNTQLINLSNQIIWAGNDIKQSYLLQYKIKLNLVWRFSFYISNRGYALCLFSYYNLIMLIISELFFISSFRSL